MTTRTEEPSLYLEFEDEAGIVHPVTITVKQGSPEAAEEAARIIAIAYGRRWTRAEASDAQHRASTRLGVCWVSPSDTC
jgi:hypothetical protein